ncbi:MULTISPECIES: YrhA family protein [Yersinia pseudotuberculosis complex]|uniref:SMI1 / KNR4 family n=2 Tax=Yersinia pseudotuberculosis complex TaxID=1649845 RepID=A0ABM5PXL1_9GAMM|nr:MULTISPECIES: YrhA family protein [Yersinia pseudotuberculosis complex]AHK19695.1 hypothetical protein BF17_10575 [Yersinia similis]CFQ65705.1 Uncharacterised protein [Yersinia similis]CNC72394.1 Uncharacterised protein [Yersinia similis]CNG43400.1 Uncharacterised protein [Yersinia similis]CRG52701.1 Uncharacterised protein [Yersinia wautersii]
MTQLNNIVDELNSLALKLEYDVLPPAVFPSSLYEYDFELKIGKAPQEFWDQYKALVELADGFDLDGFRIYGIEKHGDYENDLFTYNGYKARLDKEAPSLMSDESRYCIEIGSSSLDTYTYDVRYGKWESRDRVQYDNLFISCSNLIDFLAAILAEIREANIQ